MTLDKLVSTDLTALAVDSRRPRAFEATLHAIGVVREERRDASPEPGLLSLCRAFARRVALRSAGATALVCAIGLLALLVSSDLFAFEDGFVEEELPPWYVLHGVVAWAGSIFVVVAMTYFAGYVVGARRFERMLRAPGEPGRTRLRLQHPDAWGVGLAIAGATALATVVGSLWFSVGPYSILMVRYEMFETSANWIRDVAIVIGLVMVGAVAIGLATARGRRLRWLQLPSVGALGVVLGLVTLLAGFRFVVEPLMHLAPGLIGRGDPSYILRRMFMLSGTLSIFLVVTGIVLRRAARTEPHTAANGVGLATCRIYAHRVARVIAGSAMLACITGLLVMLAVATQESNPWYLEHGVRPWASSVLVAIALIYFASYCAGAKRFERAVAAAADPGHTGRELARRLDRWATTLGIAGTTAFVIVFGSMWFTVGDLPLRFVTLDSWRWGWSYSVERGSDPWFVWAVAWATREFLIAAAWLCEIAIALALVVVAAYAVGRAAAGGRRHALLEHPSVIALGIAVGLVTVYLGFQFDVLPIREMQGPIGIGEPSIVLRGVLVFSGTLAVFLVVAGVTLRWRRRELDDL